MAITAQDVNKLRKATGAGIMDCKKALTEAEGDFDLAVDLLRKKGQKISAKRADRDALEGAVFIKEANDGSEAFLVELNCETDFVARNSDFQTFGAQIAEVAEAEKPENVDALKALSINGDKIADTIESLVGKIGEKIDIGKYERLGGEKVITYIHPGARIGVAVAFEGLNGADVSETGRDIAMQIAAMKPIAVDKDGVDKNVIDKEMEIGKEQALAEGKPEHIVEKIAMGKVNKFLKENTLLNQDFVKDTSKTVAQHVKDSLGAGVKVAGFKRLQLGVN